jgi:hypothetical protein
LTGSHLNILNCSKLNFIPGKRVEIDEESNLKKGIFLSSGFFSSLFHPCVSEGILPVLLCGEFTYHEPPGIREDLGTTPYSELKKMDDILHEEEGMYIKRK